MDTQQPFDGKQVVLLVRQGLTIGHDGTEPQEVDFDHLCNVVASIVYAELHSELPCIESRVRHAAFEGTMAAICLAEEIRRQNVWYRRLGRGIQDFWHFLGDLAGAVTLLILLLLVLCWLKLSNLWRSLCRRLRRQPAAS